MEDDHIGWSPGVPTDRSMSVGGIGSLRAVGRRRPFSPVAATICVMPARRVSQGKATNNRIAPLVLPAVLPLALAALEERVVNCERCPRLREYCTGIARKRRRMWSEWEYWGRPVPSFGDPQARLLFVGLAPGAHGSNRTGRPFTGDGSGDFLYPALYEAGFASQPTATHRGDGLRLLDAWITSVVRCAPPGNQPLPGELANCAPYLDDEIAALPRVRVIFCLGKIGFDGVVAHLVRTGQIARRGPLQFGHGVCYAIPGGRFLMASYHPSLQNTNTGKLTREMMLDALVQARERIQACSPTMDEAALADKPGSRDAERARISSPQPTVSRRRHESNRV
jgi:uracil-DNA glycosylase family 4